MARHESPSRPPLPTDSPPLPDGLDQGAVWPGSPAEHPALVAYRLKTRRAMTVYGAILLVLLVGVLITVKEIYAHGEITHVSKQVGVAPAAVPSAATVSAATRKWTSSDLAAGGDPFADGIVVTYSPHTVNGRDALTGAVRWHYTRTDRTLCGVVQQDSSTIAIYEHDGNCDEVTGFATATGQPTFYRTLMDDGPVGISSAPNVVLVVAAGDVHVFDNAGGLDRWLWNAPTGCTVQRALAGTQGVLIGYHCADGYHLALHSLLNDQPLIWTVDSAQQLIPLSASAAVTAAEPSTGQAIRYSADKGKASSPTPLSGATGAAVGARPGLAQVQAALRALPSSQASIETSDDQNQVFEVVDVAGLIGLSAQDNQVWTAPTTGPATDAGNGVVAVVDGAVVTQREMINGAVRGRTTVAGPLPGGALKAYPVGSGVLLAGTSTGLYS